MTFMLAFFFCPSGHCSLRHRVAQGLRGCPLVSTGILAETIEILPVQGSKLSEKTSKTTNKSFGSESFKGQVPVHINSKKKERQKKKQESGGRCHKICKANTPPHSKKL